MLHASKRSKRRKRRGFEGAAGSTLAQEGEGKSLKNVLLLSLLALSKEKKERGKGDASFFPPPFKQSEMKLGGMLWGFSQEGVASPTTPLPLPLRQQQVRVSTNSRGSAACRNKCEMSTKLANSLLLHY